MNGFLEHHANFINESVTTVSQMMKVLLRSNSNIAKNIVRIGEDNLTLMFSTLGGLGLRRWKPNVLGDPNSQYNVAHGTCCSRYFSPIGETECLCVHGSHPFDGRQHRPSNTVLPEFRVFVPP